MKLFKTVCSSHSEFLTPLARVTTIFALAGVLLSSIQCVDAGPHKSDWTTQRSAGIDDFAAEALKAHNDYRLIHCSEDMVWDSQGARYAQNWANRLARDCGGISHSPGRSRPGWGENIYYSSAWSSRGANTRLPTPAKGIKIWYDEVANYDYNTTQSRGGMIGHFTQLVWKASKRLGCARSQCTNKKGWVNNYLVCNYKSFGNINAGYRSRYYLRNVQHPRSCRP